MGRFVSNLFSRSTGLGRMHGSYGATRTVPRDAIPESLVLQFEPTDEDGAKKTHPRNKDSEVAPLPRNGGWQVSGKASFQADALAPNGPSASPMKPDIPDGGSVLTHA